jgi:prepilin-type N-terminal cleavage/methylation domain-containing protein
MRQVTEVRIPGTVGSSSAPTPSRPLRRRRGGFTLIEMLVVVLIMALLMGLLVRHMRNADDRANRAATTKTIEQVSAALEEFFAEYGQYPPVPFYKGAGDVRRQPIYFEFPMAYSNPPYSDEMVQLSGTQYIGAEDLNPLSDPDLTQRLFTLGLVSFLVPRYGTVTNKSPWFAANPSGFSDPNEQWMFHTPVQGKDQDRDLAAIARWAPFLEGVIQPAPEADMTHSNALLGYDHPWINQGFTITDAWGAPLRYESVPPHQSYKLWSENPNMKD